MRDDRGDGPRRRAGRRIRRAGGSRLAAAALLVVLSLIAGCSHRGTVAGAGSTGSPSPAPSPVAGMVDVGGGVMIEAGVADGATSRSVPDASRPYGEYEALSDVHEVTVDAQPSRPTRIALPTLRDFDTAAEIPLLLVSDSPDGPWEPFPATAVPGRGLVEATTPHFSFFTALLVPAAAIVAEAKKIFDQATSGALAETEQPRCPAEAAARADGWTVGSAGPDTLKWCFGRHDDGHRLTAANNRRYPLSVAHPGGNEMARTDSAIDLGNYARFASPGRTLLLPRDAVTYAVPGPARISTSSTGPPSPCTPCRLAWTSRSAF